MAQAVYVRKGDTIEYTATEDISYLQIVPFTGCIGVAVQAIASGESGTVSIAGAYALPKATGAIKAGTAVYYNTTDNNIVTTADGNIPAGIAIEDAAESDTTVVVRIG